MKKIITLILAIVSVACCLFVVACNDVNTSDSSLAADLSKGDYDYVYDRPFYSTPDEYMTIDGVFDEEEWSNCVWMQTTQYDVTYRITTLFTQKGIYVAAYAEDPNIIFRGRNNFINNSSFEIQIVKTNEPTYGSNRYNVHRMNEFTFNADSQTCRSYRERQFNGAVKCVGEPNSGNTTSLSYEMFLGWDQMHYDESELNPQTGMPDSVRIFCQYIRIDKNNAADTRYLSPFLMDYGRYYSYYEYGPNGIVNRPDNGVVGSAINGTTSTDRWIIDNDEVGGSLKVDVNQTQHIWFVGDKEGNEVSRPTSFIVDAQVTADVGSYSFGNATFGIMTIHDMWSMVTYGVNMNELISNKRVVLQGIEGIDSTTWVGQQSFSKTVASGYTDNTICLRLIKNGGYYYYFYKHPSDNEYTYIGYEYWYKNCEDVDVGLFTNCPTTISNYSIVDYTGKEDELTAQLGQSVYFVDASDVSGGEVNLSNSILRKGESVTITALPDNGYVLHSISINDEDCFDSFVAANGSLTITPTQDVTIKAKFVRIPVDQLKNVEFTVTDPNGGLVSNADYVLQSSNPLFSRTGFTNGRGKITARIPAAGTFEIDGKTYTSDGEYTLSLSKTSYLDTTTSFTLTEDVSQTIIMRDTRWGKRPSVNGNVVSDTYGAMFYDAEKDGYYAKEGVREYYADTKANGDYLYVAKVNTVSLYTGTTINPVVGMVISSGTTATTINLKSAWWETNNLCIEIEGNEIRVNNFKHSLNNNSSSSEITIKVARLNNKLYVYDCADQLVVILDANGVHPQGGRTVSHVSGGGLDTVEKKLRDFFKNGSENVCGPLAIDPRNGRVDFEITFTTEGVKEFVYGGNITIDSALEYESEKNLDDYFSGETVTLFIKATSTKAITSLQLAYSDHTDIIDGSYDIATGATKFTFAKGDGDVAITAKTTQNIAVVAGKVSGVTQFDKIAICFGGAVNGTYTGFVQNDGTFSVKVPQGELAMAFICGDKLAIVDKQATSALGNVAVELKHNDLLVGDAIVNGKKITSKATLDFDTYKAFASGNAARVKSDLPSEKFGNNPERKEYGLLLTNSVTSGNFTLTSVMSSTGSYGEFGLAITDGDKTLAIQLGAQTQNGNWYVTYGDWREESAKFNLNKSVKYGRVDAGINAPQFSDVTLKIVKTSTGIALYIGDTQFATVTNADIGEDFFAADKEFCVVVMSQMIAGDIYHDLSLTKA